ncbi:MAG TPA: type II toxin-antitoxin system RelE/ParE family toxin [Bacteroidetes bacterium]|nr:type II toxin-antitoxin system RelE/ParE family toxin [Bacteroidota bacterium]
MNVYFSATAIRALDKIYLWYKLQRLTKIGKNKRAAIIKKSKLLKDNPYIGQMEEQLEHLNQDHRYLVEGEHKIIYRIENQNVIITDVFDTRQDPEKMKP